MSTAHSGISFLITNIDVSSPRLVGLLVDLFLIQLQQAATSSVRFGGDGRPLALESSTADPSESVGLLQFVRADVDSWAQSEPDDEGAGAETPESVAQTVTDASIDDFAVLDRALGTGPELREVY